MGLRRVIGGALVEAEQRVDVPAERIYGEVRDGADPRHVVRRHQLLADVRLTRDELLDRHLRVRGEAPDEPPNPRPAEKERRIGDQLDGLSHLPTDKAIGAVAHGLPAERRGLPLVPRDGAQQMCRQDAHVVDGVVKHLGIALLEPEDGAERIPLRHTRDPVELGPKGRSDRRIGVGVEGEFHVGRRHALSVLPARPRVEVEHQRQRPVPFPLLREQRLKVLVAHRVRGHPDVGELQEQLLVDVAGDDVFGRRRQQRGRLGDGGVDERPAVGARTAAATLTPGGGERGTDKKDEGGEVEAP